MNKITIQKYRLTISFFTLLLATFTASGQAKHTLSGHVLHSDTSEPIPFASVAIKKGRDEKILTGGLTDEKGFFRIKGVPEGKALIEIQFLGYLPMSRQIMVEKDQYLSGLLLEESVAQLDGIVIQEERSTIEQQIDRKVINIGTDLATTGAAASDIMVNLPAVDLNQDGNISLRGNQNVRILVDGKPSNIDPAQLLQQIPSTSIKKIELITSPSAKYNPEGMSGIINIVLHKGVRLGLNGTVTTGIIRGENTRYNGSVDGNYKTKKVNLFTNYSGNFGLSATKGDIIRPLEPSKEVWYSNNNKRSQLYKLGMDYFISERNTLSAYSTQTLFDGDAFRSTEIQYIDGAEGFSQVYDSDQSNTNSNYNLDFIHDFKKEGHKLELEVNVNDYHGREFADFSFDGEATLLPTSELIEVERQILTYNLDYTLPLPGQAKLEAGAELRQQQTENDYTSQNRMVNDAFYALDRNIYSIYGTFGKDFKKWSYKLGARLEHFETDGSFSEESALAQPFEDNSFNIYPSLFVKYTPNQKASAYQLSISRRVDRPNLTQLNPIRAWNSARVTNLGNPTLIPQFTNSAEFNYIRQLKNGSFTLGAFFRKTEDEIIRFAEPDPNNMDNVLFSYTNYSDNTAYGFEASGSYKISPWWNLTSSFDIYGQKQKQVLAGGLQEVDNLLYNFRMNHSFKANDKLTFQLIGLYRGSNTNLQFKTLAFYFVNVGARYSLLKKKGTLSVNFNDIFKTQQFSFEADQPVVQNGVFDWDSRTVFLGFSYRFGGESLKGLKRKKRDKNEKNSGPGF